MRLKKNKLVVGFDLKVENNSTHIYELGSNVPALFTWFISCETCFSISCSPTQRSSSQVSHPHPSLWPWGFNRPRLGYRRPRTWGPWTQSLHCPSASVSTSGLSVPQYPLATHTQSHTHTHRTVARKSFRRLLIPLSIDIPALPAHIDKHRLAANSLLKAYTKKAPRCIWTKGWTQKPLEHASVCTHTDTSKVFAVGIDNSDCIAPELGPQSPSSQYSIDFHVLHNFQCPKGQHRLGSGQFFRYNS